MLAHRYIVLDMRVAVLADIHGNLPALEAAIADAEAAGADTYVLNGDIAAGPLPAQTLDRLVALGDRAVWVHGNAERELIDAYDGKISSDLPESIRAVLVSSAAAMQPRHRDLIADLPLSVRLDVDGLGPVRFCHATARDDQEIVLVDSPVAWYQDAFAGVEEETVVLGHTHMPFDRLVDRRRFICPGSVGMPYGRAGAHWALLGPGVQLRVARYDPQQAATLLHAENAANTAPWLDEFVRENLLATPSDAEALQVFTEIARAARASA